MKKVLLLLPDGFELLEAAGFTDVFGWDMLIGSKNTQLITTGLRANITTSFNHTVQPDLDLKEVTCADFCALAIPGGFPRYGYFKAAKDRKIIELINIFAIEKKPIAAVCTATLLLGAAGILQGKQVTTYQEENGRWLQQLSAFGAIISKQSPCIDHNIITGSGPSSAIPVALHLLQTITNRQNSQLVAQMMGFY